MTRNEKIAAGIVAPVALLLFVVAPLALGMTSGHGPECVGTVITSAACFR